MVLHAVSFPSQLQGHDVNEADDEPRDGPGAVDDLGEDVIARLDVVK